MFACRKITIARGKLCGYNLCITLHSVNSLNPIVMFNEAYIIMLPIEVIPIAFIYCDLVMYAYIQFKSGSYAELIMLYSDNFSTS